MGKFKKTREDFGKCSHQETPELTVVGFPLVGNALGVELKEKKAAPPSPTPCQSHIPVLHILPSVGGLVRDEGRCGVDGSCTTLSFPLERKIFKRNAL